MLAVVAAFAITFSLSAFRVNADAPQTKEKLDHYFQYEGDLFEEADYLTPGNWSKRGLSPGSACGGAQQVVCVIKAETADEEVTDLMTYLNTVVGAGNIKSFIENPSNIEYLRPTP